MELKYTDEKNVLLLIALLKASNIKHVIVSPGTTNFTFVASLQNDNFFKLYSCVDERGAAYMACGMAMELNEPVVITCTGATASRNYLPGLTEAYYRKLPILAVCGHRGISAIGHLFDQQLDRRNEPVDTANKQVWLPFIKDKEDEQLCYNEINKAIIALHQHGGGPVIVNLCTRYSQNLTEQELPNVKRVEYYSAIDRLPELPKGRIAITIGSHRKFTKEETEIIDTFCASHDVVVFCDHTSGYHGKYGFNSGLIFGQERPSELSCVDLCIHVGEISGDGMGLLRVWAKDTWRIGEDGTFRNRTNNVSKIIEMPLAYFCKHYLIKGANNENYLNLCKEEYNKIYSLIPELPFSNVWIAKQLAPNIPENSSVYLGIYNSLRSWNLFKLPKHVDTASNVGGFGIDGILSSAIGRAICNPAKLTYCVLGDLSFFYDMNAIGNRHITNNLRILVINNGLGDEFRIYDNPTHFLGEEVRPYIAAEGHFGLQSPLLIKSYAESLGFKYLVALDKETFLRQMSEFTSPEIHQSIIFEVMVKPEDDTDALDIVKHILRKQNNTSFKKKLKSIIKDKIGNEKLEAIRTILK